MNIKPLTKIRPKVVNKNLSQGYNKIRKFESKIITKPLNRDILYVIKKNYPDNSLF